MQKLQLSGQTFGKWLVIEEVQSEKKGTFWKVKCTGCNITETVVSGSSLSKSRTTQCKACATRETQPSQHLVKHGMTESTEYTSWEGMIERCYNMNKKGYKNYGGRGIQVCDRWKETFENFLSDMSLKPSKEYSIDRIDVNGNYEPGNCRWATVKEQSINKSNTRFVEYQGEKVTLVKLAERFNVPYKNLLHRINKGWTVERAIISDRNQALTDKFGTTVDLTTISLPPEITPRLVKQRLIRGWSIEEAIVNGVKIRQESTKISTKRIELAGQKFNLWTAVKRAEGKERLGLWLCKCECGTEQEISVTSLRNGRSTGCRQCYFKRRKENNSNKILQGE